MAWNWDKVVAITAIWTVLVACGFFGGFWGSALIFPLAVVASVAIVRHP